MHFKYFFIHISYILFKKMYLNMLKCTHFNMISKFHIGLLKSTNVHHIEIWANCYIDTISSYY